MKNLVLLGAAGLLGYAMLPAETKEEIAGGLINISEAPSKKETVYEEYFPPPPINIPSPDLMPPMGFFSVPKEIVPEIISAITPIPAEVITKKEPHIPSEYVRTGKRSFPVAEKYAKLKKEKAALSAAFEVHPSETVQQRGLRLLQQAYTIPSGYIPGVTKFIPYVAPPYVPSPTAGGGFQRTKKSTFSSKKYQKGYQARARVRYAAARKERVAERKMKK